MRVVLFCHSLISDWNHGNAHFLRGVATDLLARGHDVRVFEPENAWSVTNLLEEGGPAAIVQFHRAYPRLSSTRFDAQRLDLDEALDGADLVLVHEWNEHPLVERIGRHRVRSGRYMLFFHDTHHRSVTDEPAMAAYDLQHYDGVLAFGDVIRERYVARGWARRAFTWHEAADVRTFAPRDRAEVRSSRLPTSDTSAAELRTGSCGVPPLDVIWIGNWGDEERSQEIRDYFIAPVRELMLRAEVYGVRYPAAALRELGDAGIAFRGWLPNYRVPEAFGRTRATVHVPRRPYVEALPGVPTIRVFEALACGIPLVSCWWNDCERLFEPRRDFLMVRSPEAMRRALRDVLNDAALAAELAAAGRRTILARHTCTHRVDELFAILSGLRAGAAAEEALRA